MSKNNFQVTLFYVIINVLILSSIDMNSKKYLILIGISLLFIGVALFVFSSDGKQSLDTIPSILKSIPTNKPPSQSSSPSFDLTGWKLTLPLMSSANSKDPLEIRQPELASYQINPWFRATSDKKGFVFRAPVNAPTTANSTYPRSELREMTADGKDEFFWSSKKGTHTLFIEEAITAVPKNKKDVVAGQIHGDDDDLIVIRLEDNKLFLARSKKNLATLDDNYVLGKKFTIKFVAQNGKILTYYNQNPKPIYTLEKKVDQAYFKVGVYTQSNCETEESPNLCSGDNYGEVVIYQLRVTHE
ncbi:MAG: Alginate lyase 2 [Candidatus Moranbacteria bacterium GW2011_GWE1_35_17]|nr:MAG: Alginate lyase 2 [Candidatus Moranbacteria bacterium GW2011_GWE1_35_17]KKP84088.1 MAG: Alginate lyase 2 [Candidatus Moranbacteria bacterium GW2011_GWF1_35_5]KKP85030.1 MAG: Alginate lyase 2 [Candidatus Moranbacteria bacterium GW2011_GWF2_35_54]